MGPLRFRRRELCGVGLAPWDRLLGTVRSGVMSSVGAATWVMFVLVVLTRIREGGTIRTGSASPAAFTSPPSLPKLHRTTTKLHALGTSSTRGGGDSGSGSLRVKRGWFDPTTAMPPHTWRISPSTEVKMRPDLSAKGFSALNAFFFAGMSKIAYATEDEARGLLLGNATEKGLGFDKLFWFEGGKPGRKNPFSKVHDTDAFIAANDDMIAVVFRGTKGIDDWYTNAMFQPKKCPPEWEVPPPGGSVHTGYNDAVSTVWLSTPDGKPTGMCQIIRALCEEKGKKRKLFLAGHSLGGALATNAAARLAFVDNIDIAGIYTIGSPRVFERRAAKHFDRWLNHGTRLKQKYFRCRNHRDPVTIVPGNPYAHVGTEIYIDQFGTISMSSMANRLLDQLLWWLRFEYIRGIDDHSTSEYIRLFKQIVLNSRVPLMEKAATALGDLVLKVAPDAMGGNEMLEGMLKGMAKNNKMLDDMMKGVERRKGLVEDVKGRARVASQEY
ncbi:unnamed protein product [Scytosiphon promiscuus]